MLDENQNPTGVYTCTVGLAKIYDKIWSVIGVDDSKEELVIDDNVSSVKIVNCTSNSLDIVVELREHFDKLKLAINWST